MSSTPHILELLLALMETEWKRRISASSAQPAERGEKKVFELHFSPMTLLSSLGGDSVFPEKKKKTLVNQVNGRKKKSQDHQCRSFYAGTEV